MGTDFTKSKPARLGWHCTPHAVFCGWGWVWDGGGASLVFFLALGPGKAKLNVS